MKPEDCTVVILASGNSKRFGDDDKLMTNVLGKPLFAHSLEMAKTIQFAHHLAVIQNHQALACLCEQAGYDVITNNAPHKGRGHALMLAAKTTLSLECANLCVLLADMPFVNEKHVLTMLEHATTPVTISTYKAVHMPPVIFSGPTLKALANSTPRNTVIKTAIVTDIPLSKHSAQDIDTRTDLSNLEKQEARKGEPDREI